MTVAVAVGQQTQTLPCQPVSYSNSSPSPCHHSVSSLSPSQPPKSFPVNLPPTQTRSSMSPCQQQKLFPVTLPATQALPYQCGIHTNISQSPRQLLRVSCDLISHFNSSLSSSPSNFSLSAYHTLKLFPVTLPCSHPNSFILLCQPLRLFPSILSITLFPVIWQATLKCHTSSHSDSFLSPWKPCKFIPVILTATQTFPCHPVIHSNYSKSPCQPHKLLPVTLPGVQTLPLSYLKVLNLTPVTLPTAHLTSVQSLPCHPDSITDLFLSLR